MLGFIHGKVLSKNIETCQCVVLVHKLGFEVTLPKRIFETIVDNQQVRLWLYTHVREDILQLYGFSSEQEKHFFKMLLGVSGLGPRTALSLIGEHGVDHLIQLIMKKAAKEIATAPGVGKKLGERIVLELESKVEKFAWIEEKTGKKETSRPAVSSPIRELRADLTSALLNLGYAPNPIKLTLDRLLTETGDVPPFESCLKAALREMSNRSVLTDRSGHG